MIGMIMFGVALLMLMLGFPVAFTFGGVALFFGIFAEGMDLFAFMPYRIMSVMQNTVLMAVPLFIFMGVVLQRTRLAEQLLTSMGRLCVRHPRSDRAAIHHPYYSGRCPWPSGWGSVQGRGLARRCVGGALHHLHPGADQAET